MIRRRVSGALGLLAAAALLAAGGCTGEGGGADTGRETQDTAGGDLKIVATTAPVAALAREVAGDRARVRAIMPAGIDPHQFEPTASDLAALDGAELILRHGIGLDGFLDDIIERAGGRLVVTVTEGIPLQRGALGGDAGFDPHVWLDPILAQVMVENIRDGLRQVDPGGGEAYESNAEAYKSRLAEVDREVRAIIETIPPEDRKLVTNHDGFGYFARRYGLEIVGAVIPTVSTEGEPSARETAALLDIIRKEGVKAIFAESSVNPDLARQLARDAGVAVVDNLYVDSLGGPGSDVDTVHDMLLANARLIAEALR